MKDFAEQIIRMTEIRKEKNIPLIFSNNHTTKVKDEYVLTIGDNGIGFTSIEDYEYKENLDRDFENRKAFCYFYEYVFYSHFKKYKIYINDFYRRMFIDMIEEQYDLYGPSIEYAVLTLFHDKIYNTRVFTLNSRSCPVIEDVDLKEMKEFIDCDRFIVHKISDYFDFDFDKYKEITDVEHIHFSLNSNIWIKLYRNSLKLTEKQKENSINRFIKEIKEIPTIIANKILTKNLQLCNQ